MPLAVGVDGWRLGWVAVALRDGRFDSAHSAPSLAAILDRYPDARTFAVDIPIGLPEAGVRACDVAARRLLGPRRSSVFRAPTAAAGAAATPREARRIDPALSAQGANLLAKIKEAGGLADDRVFEVHPEVSFWAMAGRHLPQPKRTWAGLHDRLQLLAGQAIELPAELGAASAVPPDDVVDAAAAAWTATRIAEGRARTVVPGLGPNIWY